MGNYRVGSRTIATTNEDKLMYPGITKGDVITYYAEIAPIMVPYLKDRALTLVRYPHGIKGESFFQKNIGDYFPAWIKRKTIAHTSENNRGEKTTYVVCNNAATLVYLANQAALVLHTPLSKIDKLDYPDRMIFDLDPPNNKSFALVKKTALALRDLLKKRGLTSYVMTTGSRGLHVLVPIKRMYTFDQVRAFALECAQGLIEKDPDHLTVDIRKNKRGKRLFIDTLRNAFGHTAVAPYSLRAYPHAPIATPIEWKELAHQKLSSQSYNISNIAQRLKLRGDPWRGIERKAQKLVLKK
jgi:bifunctional non-homologous end joining protein LigD